jgi:hypothetical protein
LILKRKILMHKFLAGRFLSLFPPRLRFSAAGFHYNLCRRAWAGPELFTQTVEKDVRKASA